MAMSDDFEADLTDPILIRDIELSKDKIDFLKARKDACFLCAWILEDYEKNKTLTGVKREGGFGKYEIFPMRGEINHLWLELHGKPYPFKKKVSKYEETILKSAPPMLTAPGIASPEGSFVPQDTTVSKPGGEKPAEVVKNIDAVPVAKPKR
jgi:hypothetical protein